MPSSSTLPNLLFSLQVSSVTNAFPIPYPLHLSMMNAVGMEWVTPGFTDDDLQEAI